MAEHPTRDIPVLNVRERLLLFCVGSGTDWQRVGVLSENVTAMTVKRLISRDALGRLSLTNSGRKALRVLLPEL
jgi:hypothetical protein